MNSHKPLKMKEYVKYLGVYIDADLSWKHHTEHISGKINKCVGVSYSKVTTFCSSSNSFILSIFQSLISPYLTYGICAWGQDDKVHTNKLLILQKKALRLMFFAKPTDHAILFFQQTRSLSLTFLLGCLCGPVIKWAFGRRCQKVVSRGREDTRVWYRETMFSQLVSYEFLLHGA